MLMIGFFSCAWGQVETAWISQGVVPGEKTLFYILITNGQSISFEQVPKVEGASVRLSNNGYIPYPGALKNTAMYIEIEIVADKPGTVTIPSISLKAGNGDVYHTNEQVLTVYPFSEIKWHERMIGNGKLKYGTLWHIPNKSPYINQPVPCEVKIYAPQDISTYQLPSIQKNGVATTQNFQPGIMPSNVRPMGMALVQGQDWSVMTFQTSFYPLRSGEISMGGDVTGYALQVSHNQMFAQFVQSYIDIPLSIPEIKMTARDFPPGAPQGFTNAVGQFRVKAETSAPDLSANEPIMVDITVEGSGNINAIECPAIADSSRWKLYPATRMGDATTSGQTSSIRFQQSMRPIQEVDAIPSFSLSFFNPETEKYHTVSSPAIPLPWKQTNSNFVPATPGVALPPPAGIVPVEQMADIYGFVPSNVIASLPLQSSWKWYLPAYIPFVLIIAVYLFKTVKRRRALSAASRERWTAFKALDTNGPASQFLRSLGTFIETRIPPGEIDAPLQEILKQRDEQAFLPETSAPDLPQEQRASMLKSVKNALSKLSLLIISLLFLGGGHLSAQDEKAGELYQKGEFSQALNMLEEPSADARIQAGRYYGMGDCLYRLNRPGEAALAYHRALALSPRFTEARRNLQFIERKEGAILPPMDGKNEWLTFVPHSCLLPVILLSGAVFLTALSLLLIRRRYAVLLSLVSVLFLLVAAAGITNLILYPELPSTIDQNRLLIATKATEARHAADKDSPALMRIPASTPLILEAERGSWFYVRTFTGTPAWIEASSAGKVSPQP